MNEADRYAECDGRPLLISWRVEAQLFCTFEVDLEAAETLVPEQLPVVELRPGVALLSVGALRFAAGHFGADSPALVEVYAAMHVAPDLSVDMPLPTMTMSTFSVLSDSEDFVDQEGHTLYAPARLDPSLSLDFADDGLGVHIADDEGPILSVPSEHPEARWVAKEMWGQHYTNTRGLQQGIWQWDGQVFEHMRPGRGWEVFEHSFWAGLEPKRIRRCYRQMMLQPGTIGHERFWAMRPV